MPKVKLTNTFINRIKIPKSKKKILYLDSVETGLAVEIRATGTKTFYYRYNQDSKTYQKKLASSSTIKVEDARTIVKNLKAQKEKNTTITINALLNNEKKAITLKKFWDEYYYPYIQVNKRSYKSYLSFFKNHILPHFGKYPMNTISPIQITKHQANLITKYKLNKNTANKFTRYLSTAYKKAIEWNIEFVTSNPLQGIKEYKVDNLKENYLSHHEIQRLLDIADQHPNDLNIANLIRFYLFTGARKNEALNAKWCDIDTHNKVWTIPLSKSGKTRTVPISPALEELLVNLPKTSDYLFPSPLTNKKIYGFYRHWDSIRKKADLGHIRLHDLRHTFASLLVNNNISIYQVQKILGHSNVNVTMRYAHLSNKALYDAISVVDDIIK